jgi:hypothetical protein
VIKRDIFRKVPPRSLELTSIYFFLWGHLNENVYVVRPTTISKISLQNFKQL